MIPAASGATVLRRPEQACVARHEPRQDRADDRAALRQIIPTASAGAGVFGSRQRQCITILLDPGRFLNRLQIDLILNLPRMAAASIDRGNFD